ncbi:hypothetical protein HMPREF9718_01576 [Sphingobium yanoikuyae ATCC 51230]|uniref:OsmC-like protein n=1 Tax=Sphingobium yanoikuyae ATCC 51230 TaxID=883163 RepID=K9CVB7_SPHYA|nr:hypothetical protein HMPREF9718_01576 [Sphingobium yanoikuyae ATCC 51230]
MAQGSAHIGKDRYRTEIVVGGHAITADEPEALGGANLGPAPYDLLLAALGACTAITLRMYRRRRGGRLNRSTSRCACRARRRSGSTGP